MPTCAAFVAWAWECSGGCVGKWKWKPHRRRSPLTSGTPRQPRQRRVGVVSAGIRLQRKPQRLRGQKLSVPLECFTALTAVGPEDSIPSATALRLLSGTSCALNCLTSKEMSLLLLARGPVALTASDRFCLLNNSQRMPENVKFKCRKACCYL